MGTYTTVQIDRLVMREDFTVTEGGAPGYRTIDLTGQESMHRLNLATVKQRRADFLNLAGKLVPVVFTEKSDVNGFYYVDSVEGVMENWWDELAMFNWSASLSRVGSVGEIDIESKLSGPLSRLNDFAVAGSRVHAPSIGHSSYNSGATVPIFIDRVSADGTIRVYRNLAVNIHPRWAIDPASYNAGRVRFIDGNGNERSGEAFNTPSAGWELSNGLVRVRPTDVANTTERISNPGFETDTSGWFAVGATLARSTVQFRSGVASGLVTPDGVTAIVESGITTSASPTVTPGIAYKWDIWVRSPIADIVAPAMAWRDGAGNIFQTTVGPDVTLVANTWTLLSLTATAPAGSVTAGPRVRMPGTPAVTDTLYMDDASFKELSRTFTIDAWDSGVWSSKRWDIIAGTAPAVSIAPFDYCSVLHNTQEAIALRLTKNLAPGRSTVDLILKRGSRFVEIYIQHQFGTTLKIVRSEPEAGTVPAGAGFVEATTADADGNKYVIGSARTFTSDTTNGGLSKAATSTLDAFIGIELNGDTAAVGDEAAELYKQYIGSPAETVLGVRR